MKASKSWLVTMQKINLIAQSVLELSHREKSDDDDDDTHPGWIIVRDEMYSVADKKPVPSLNGKPVPSLNGKPVPSLHGKPVISRQRPKCLKFHLSRFIKLSQRENGDDTRPIRFILNYKWAQGIIQELLESMQINREFIFWKPWLQEFFAKIENPNFKLASS